MNFFQNSVINKHLKAQDATAIKSASKRIKDESISQEDVVTKSLYNDYSLFKRELHQNLVALNPNHDPLTLFRKSQK